MQCSRYDVMSGSVFVVQDCTAITLGTCVVSVRLLPVFLFDASHPVVLYIGGVL